ncbi:MAG: SEC-C domain-containing protein [Candidatus Omnitrophica bacterium]|nr:SEC-C domain-containing protein [Candidatus Omnitrophota bacterium]
MNEQNFAQWLKNTGRNDQCPCDSGNKYKKCHLSEDELVQHKEMQKQKEAAVAKDNENSSAERQESDLSHFNVEVRPKLKLNKAVAHRNVPRRQAGK